MNAIRSKFKTKRQFVTALCLVIGMLLLTTSVYASYGDANGYVQYKNALKALATETDNVTGEVELGIYIDDTLVESVKLNMEFAGDKGRSTMREISGSNGSAYERIEYIDGSEQTTYYPESGTYHTNKIYRSDITNLTGIDVNDKTTQKVIRFMELGADMVIGDLKNNVVLVGNEDGVKEYQIAISRGQMPEIINAGLSLMFTSLNSYDAMERTNYTTYDDWSATMDTWSMEHYGKHFDWDEAHELSYAAEDEQQYWDDFWEEYDAIQIEMQDYYDELFKNTYDREGILVIMGDGSTKHFDNFDEYVDAMMLNVSSSSYSVYAMFGDDPYIENATMTVKLDEQGRLVANYAEATMAGVGRDGEKHTASIKVNVNLSDYGTTDPARFEAPQAE